MYCFTSKHFFQMHICNWQILKMPQNCSPTGECHFVAIAVPRISKAVARAQNKVATPKSSIDSLILHRLAQLCVLLVGFFTKHYFHLS